MTSLVRSILIGVLLFFLNTPRPAVAGMPSFALGDLKRTITQTVTEPTRQRLEAISFFLLGLLLSAVVVRGIWNSFSRDFAWLPRLSYGKALGVIVLWGLLFVLVLTMISGARELMTPGAWKKSGWTYQIADDSAAVEDQIAARYRALERLSNGLFDYAKAHGKIFPAVDFVHKHPTVDEIPDAHWRIPGAAGERYVYVGGSLSDEENWAPRQILAYESEAFGTDRLVLMTDGWIIWMPISEIERNLAERGRSR